MYRVGIVGDGYTAVELLRLLAGHPQLEPVYVSSIVNVGRRVDEVYPQFFGSCNLLFQPTDVNLISEQCEAVFLAVPHGESAVLVNELLPLGVKCIDLGADFRLQDPGVYANYYGLKHPHPELLPEAVYGLPELYRRAIKAANLIANPGCFPTSAIIPLVPLLAAKLVAPEGLIIDSKSGVTGAGRSAKVNNLFCEVNDGFHAYGVGTHRHAPEIAQILSEAAGSTAELTFTPHLVPMNRGIFTTSYARLTAGATENDVRAALLNSYEDEPFIRILPPGVIPHSKWVYGSNFVFIGVSVNEPKRQVILLSVIDNLTKGASGQAIQNLNIMLGIEETAGLTALGVMP